VHAAVLDKGLPITGCTVHFVDNQYDHGPIIAQQSVVVEANDTPESLANRVFQTECELYPRVIAALARGEIHVAGDEVVVAPFPPSSIN
jgi:phosphoribosylglycinamide formyltransferase-1